MSKKKIYIPDPTAKELEILQILWGNGPSSVRFVNDKIQEKHSVGYTTTLKIMQIMTAKKILTRSKDGKNHIYKAGLQKDETTGNLIKKFVDNVFQGSSSNLIMQILGNTQPTKEELEKVKNYLNKLQDND